jgi:hypothetical protein
MPRNDQGWPSLPCGPRRATRHVSTSSAIPITTPAGAAMRTGPPTLRKRGTAAQVVRMLAIIASAGSASTLW